MTKPHRPEPGTISRRLAWGFGSVGLLSAIMFGLLLSVVVSVGGLVKEMSQNEASIRQGLALATSVRELSLQIAHTAALGDETHLGRYEEWRERTREKIQQLAGTVPPSERFRVELVAEATQSLHDQFISTLVAAVRAGDAERIKDAHRPLDELGQRAAHHADLLAFAARRRMAQAHTDASSRIRFGIVSGAGLLLFIVALGLTFTMQLRDALVVPLARLSEAARRIGRGDFDARVGKVGEGEVLELADALDLMADELEVRQERLKKEERMAVVGQLAAGVAHELNNPIGIMRGYLKTMSPQDPQDQLREELSILDEEAAQCQRIAEDLLSFARTTDLERQQVQMASFLADVAKRVSGGAAPTSKGIQVDAADGEVWVDPGRLRQVLLNLLTNADQVSAGKTPAVLRGRMIEDGSYLIEVEDDGPGVAPEERDRIFEPFFSKRPGGTGLGLSVAAGIVRAHGGTIEVTAGDRGGARFRVVLPGAEGTGGEASECPLDEAEGEVPS